METENNSSQSLAVHTCEILGKYPDLNDMIAAANKHWHVYKNMKKNAQCRISWFLHSLPQIRRPVKIHFIWHEADYSRDPDNVSAASKFIIDELVRLRKIQNDSARCIKGIHHDYAYGGQYKVTVYLEECKRST